MIRAVFFDLDGTLYDRDATIRGVLAEQCEQFGSDLAAIALESFVARVIELDNHGYCRTREVYDAIAAEFGLERPLAERLIEHYWASFDRHCRPEADAIETLGELRHRGQRVGIITNGTAAFQQHKVDVLGLRPLIDAVLVSESEGVSKPHREIFERAASRVDLTVGDCCYVGDHPQFDIEGAAAAGMFAVWKHTPYWSLAIPATTISRIGEVLSLVGTAAPQGGTGARRTVD
jgi:putative hydrolase of the HAD superfamily